MASSQGKSPHLTNPARPTTEQVITQVTSLIGQGKLRPGDQLPPEREFARELGISRPSLRAGLRSLIAMGVLRARQGSGTYVADGPPVLDSVPLELMAMLHGFRFEQMFEARRVLEVTIAGLTAERASEEEVARIGTELEAMKKCQDNPQKYLFHDIRFHKLIGSASGNPILAALVEMVSSVMYEHRKNTISRARDVSQSMLLHDKIFQAIRLHRPSAARAAMEEHLIMAQAAYDSEEQSAQIGSINGARKD